MFDFSRLFRALGVTLIAGALLSACGGSRNAGSSALPTLPAGHGSAHAALPADAAPTASTTVVALNAGGSAAGAFTADKYFVAAGTQTYKVGNTIDTSGVTSPAPQAVYQAEREGSAITYTIPGLTAGAAYTVRLSFAELYWTTAGNRIFNITINGTKVQTNFDIIATTGGPYRAVAKSFNATATSTGTIVIAFNAVKDLAAISGIQVATNVATPTPTPTPTPAATLAINAGGAASGSFIADTDFVAAGTQTYKVNNAINTSAVTNPGPQAVYQDEREGATIAYTIPGLAAGTAYTVRLSFAELYWTSAGKRIVNVSINGTKVLSNFDTYAAAGAPYKVVTQSFNAVASSGGTISITLTAVIDLAAINALEITAGSGPTPTPTPTPTATPTTAFNDYTTFGYDNQRDVYNPNSTAITPASLSSLHLAWQATLGNGDFNSQTQPVLATKIAGHAGVLYVGGGTGNVYAYDATSGALMWTRPTGQETYLCEGNNTIYFGVGGTVAYDPTTKSLYVVGNVNSAPDATATNSLYHLDGTSGAVLGQVNFAPPLAGWTSLDFSHTSVTLGNGVAYVGTGATCDISSWRGRIVAVSVPSMTVSNTFFPVWNGTSQPWGGGGVWGWGGVSLDFNGNVLSGIGNTDDGSTTHGGINPPFSAAPHEYSGLGEAFVKLSPDLSTVVDSNHPIPLSAYSGNSVDLDMQGTPAVFQPNGSGCDPMAALQAKSGALYIYDTTRIGSGLLAQYQLAPGSYSDGFLGGPAFSPATGLLYAGVSSSSGSLYPPGMVAINPGCGVPSVAWHSAFGPDSYPSGIPRSVPAASAGGVVFIGTWCNPNGSGGCSGSPTSSAARRVQSVERKPKICCAPPGSGDGALWALDASTGAVLNGGLPLITTSAPLRVPPTIDGNWVFVLDTNGVMYGLTIDPNFAAVAARSRSVDARMLRSWEPRPGTH